MKFLNGLYKALVWFFGGIIAGIVIFIKFLDTPEYSQVFKKIKIKGKGNDIKLDPSQIVEKELTRKEKRIKRKNER